MGLFRRIWPKHVLIDQLAFSFTHVGLISMCLFELFVVLPIYHEPYSNMFYVHFVAGMFILCQVFTNMYAMILTDTTAQSSNFVLPSVLYQDWKYCPICQLNVPPRSHHCKICDVCIIKRDHHCIFTGRCVGFLNHRYFLYMSAYLWMGCFYTVAFNYEYYFKTLDGFRWGLIFEFLCPMLAYIFGFANLHQLGILVVGGINFVAMFLFSCLMGFQLFFISRGQTQFECKKKCMDFSRSFSENWKVVLGSRWYLTWLGSFVQSPLPGTGTDFKKTSTFIEEDVKTI